MVNSLCSSPFLPLQTKLSDTFLGKVVEVVSGDCLMIKDLTSGVERRVQLSRCVTWLVPALHLLFCIGSDNVMTI